ncbi:MAG: T9SS C-terminal target domain-containing protein, partial [Candidatus Latescibacterota bacterium]
LLQEGEVRGTGDSYALGAQTADLALFGQRIFVALVGESSLVELRMPTPDRILFTRNIPLPAEGAGLVVRDSLLYVAMTTAGLGIYDVASIDTVFPIGFYEGGGGGGGDLGEANALHLALDGDIAYVTTADPGRSLFLIDVSDPASPEFRSTYATGRRPLTVAAKDGIAYVSQRVQGLVVIDATNPSAPDSVGTRREITLSRRLAVVENYMFAARRGQGMSVYDLSVPSFPSAIWQEKTPENASDVALFGAYLAEADGSAFRLYKQDFVNADLAAPNYAIGILSNPFANAYVDIIVVASEALVDKPAIRLVMGETDSSLFVFRLDSPHNVYRSTFRLSQIGTAEVFVTGEDLSGNKSDVSRAFSVEYVRGSKGGSIYESAGKVEVRIPARETSGDSYVLLAPVDALDPDVAGGDVPAALAGPFRLSLGRAEGPVVVRAHDLVFADAGKTPVLYRKEEGAWTPCATKYDAEARVAEADLSGSSIFLLALADEGPPEPPLLRVEPNRPNPFNPRTTIALHLSREARLCVSIYDVAGRRVRALEDRRLAAGAHLVVWDGTGDDGRAAGSGIYFARIEADDRTLTRKMVLLR